MWEDYANLFIKSIFIENMVFAYFLGMCSYLAISKTLKNGVGMGLAVIFVLTITVPLNYLIYEYLLVDGALSWIGPEYAQLDLSFLSLIMFIAVIASMVQLVEMIVEKFSPALYADHRVFGYFRGSRLWFWVRSWVVHGNCCNCCNQRKNRILKCSCTSKRLGHNFYNNRFDGSWIHEFYGN